MYRLHYHPLIYRTVHTAIKLAVGHAGAVPARPQYRQILDKNFKLYPIISSPRVEYVCESKEVGTPPTLTHGKLHNMRKFNSRYLVVMPNQVNGKIPSITTTYILQYIANYVLHISVCRSQN